MGTNPDAISSVLFGKTRRNVLGLLLVEPDKAFSLREIVRRTSGGQGAVQRELRRLAEAGIIKREAIGRNIVYRADPSSPVYEELRGLIAKTVGVVEQVRRALSPLRDHIDVSFIYGSYAREMRIRPGSDIDVMIIGDLSFGAAVEEITPAQDVLGRDVNPTVYTSSEFVSRIRDRNHFVQDVLQHPKLFVIGGPRELERLAEVGMADNAPADSRRDSSTARRGRARPS